MMKLRIVERGVDITLEGEVVFAGSANIKIVVKARFKNVAEATHWLTEHRFSFNTVLQYWTKMISY